MTEGEHFRNVMRQTHKDVKEIPLHVDNLLQAYDWLERNPGWVIHSIARAVGSQWVVHVRRENEDG